MMLKRIIKYIFMVHMICRGVMKLELVLILISKKKEKKSNELDMPLLWFLY